MPQEIMRAIFREVTDKYRNHKRFLNSIPSEYFELAFKPLLLKVLSIRYRTAILNYYALKATISCSLLHGIIWTKVYRYVFNEVLYHFQRPIAKSLFSRHCLLMLKAMQQNETPIVLLGIVG